jgi:isopentenyl diphosphate isomerase/L-lactate dehydrogenase-like FMN-dependent dehydrogenase
MFLTGSADIAHLRRRPPVVLGETAGWLERLGSEVPR